MILTGWKEIARYLSCGIRTAQRWESKGLPIRRPVPGKRSHVVADSVNLDSWVNDTAFWRNKDLSFWRGKDLDILENIQRARELCAEVQQARMNLHLKMGSLRKEMAALRARRRRKEEG